MKHLLPEAAEAYFAETLWPEASGVVFKGMWHQYGSPSFSEGCETREGAEMTFRRSLQTIPEDTKVFIAGTKEAKARGATIYRMQYIDESSLQRPESVAFLRRVLQGFGRFFSENEQLHVFSSRQISDWRIELPTADYTSFADTTHVRTYIDPATHVITHREFFHKAVPDDQALINEGLTLRDKLLDHVQEMPTLSLPEDGQFCFDAVAAQLGLRIPARFR